MRKTIAFLTASMLLSVLSLCGGAYAQVINGEGDYEGSSLHTPPPQTDAQAARRTDSGQKPSDSKTPSPDERK